MALWTWRVMFGSGLRIGMTETITKTVLTKILRDQIMVRNVFFGAAAGTTMKGISGHLYASGTLRRAGSTTTGFVVSGTEIITFGVFYPFTLGLSGGMGAMPPSDFEKLGA